jgi:hypothetical protein
MFKANVIKISGTKIDASFTIKFILMRKLAGPSKRNRQALLQSPKMDRARRNVPVP